jgi:hypothetical protein
MKKLMVDELELIITNPREILKIGGPYVGDVLVENKLISTDCVLENFLFNKELGLLFFVKFYQLNFYQFFTINFYNQGTDTLFEFETEFDMLYLKRIINKNELEVYTSFTDYYPDKRLIFSMDSEEFHKV